MGGGSFSSRLKASFAAVLYLCCGPVLILLNRHIIKEIGFPFPATVSGLGMLTSAIISVASVHVFGVVKLQHRANVTQMFYVTRILPVGLCSVLTLYCGNKVYLFLSVSLIQMLKAFTPVMVVIFLYIFRVSRPTSSLVAAVLVICAGTALTSLGTVSGSFVGLLVMLGAEVFEALRLVLSQTLLSSAGMKFSIIESLYWLAPATVMWLVTVLIPMLELNKMQEMGALSVVMQHPSLFIASGVLGFGVNFCSFFVMQTSSALVLKLLGTLRNISLIAFSIMFYGDSLNISQYCGFAVALTGFVWFQMIKMRGGGSTSWSDASVLPNTSKA